MNPSEILAGPILKWGGMDHVDRTIMEFFRRDKTVPRDLFELQLERNNQRGYLSKRILKVLLEPVGRWKLYTDEEADPLYRNQPEIIFPFYPKRRSFLGLAARTVHQVRLRLRTVFMDYTTSGGSRIDLNGY